MRSWSQEPIVDSIEDAVACFLTTNLTSLVIGNFIVDKKDIFPGLKQMKPRRLPHVVVEDRSGSHSIRFERDPIHIRTPVPLSSAVFQLLTSLDENETIEAGLGPAVSESALKEIFELWSKRLLRVAP